MKLVPNAGQSSSSRARRLRLDPLDALTDLYVAGHIDVDEFEERVGNVLAGRPDPEASPFMTRLGTVRELR